MTVWLENIQWGSEAKSSIGYHLPVYIRYDDDKYTWVIYEFVSGNNKEIMSLLISKEIYAEDIGKERITKRQLKDTRIKVRLIF